MRFSEKSWSSSSSSSAGANKLFFYFITTLLFATAITSILFTLFVWNPHAWSLRLVNQCVVANSNEARFPVEFADNLSFATISPSSDKLWEDLVPPNLCLVMKMGEKGERVPYRIAMFHQLYCLQEIRTALQNAVNPNRQTEKKHASENHPEALPWHVLHCFDYMRHAILCMADNNFEPPERLDFGGYLIEGLSVHQCRDPAILYQQTETDRDEIAKLMDWSPSSAALAAGVR